MGAEREHIEPFTVVGEYFEAQPNGRCRCTLCPRYCVLSEGQKGFCFVREARNQQIVLTSYGRSTGFCIDPIEKKPLNHFLPGTSVLSFGTAGCNLGCKFCQNWDISKAREIERLSSEASPTRIAQLATSEGCASVAFTYNDPVIFHEYVHDTAIACHEAGLRTVAVTAGYIDVRATEKFFAPIDAVNIDLKAFTKDFYRQYCYADLAPVLETLDYLAQQERTWFEITTLLIPGLNDSDAEIDAMCEWLLRHVGCDVPLHFSAFHPDFKMTDIPRTPLSTLLRARKRAQSAGIAHVYIGNAHDVEAENSWCAGCGALLIERVGYRVTTWFLDKHGCCDGCGVSLPGRFSTGPGEWDGGRRRVSGDPR